MMFIIALIILIFGLGLNLSVGASDIGIIDSLKYLFVWDGSKEQLIISTLRLPRTLIGVFVGASLAVAGALMQAMTRNPLASPQIFGVNAGASLLSLLLSSSCRHRPILPLYSLLRVRQQAARLCT